MSTVPLNRGVQLEGPCETRRRLHMVSDVLAGTAATLHEGFKFPKSQAPPISFPYQLESSLLGRKAHLESVELVLKHKQ